VRLVSQETGRAPTRALQGNCAAVCNEARRRSRKPSRQAVSVRCGAVHRWNYDGRATRLGKQQQVRHPFSPPPIRLACFVSPPVLPTCPLPPFGPPALLSTLPARPPLLENKKMYVLGPLLKPAVLRWRCSIPKPPVRKVQHWYPYCYMFMVRPYAPFEMFGIVEG
jgi:hypothetical protein